SLISAKGPVSEGFSPSAPVVESGSVDSGSVESGGNGSSDMSIHRPPNKAMALRARKGASQAKSDLSEVKTASDLQSLNGASPTPASKK
ncbi:MAG: hypothetical protein AAFY78_25080, partial [Cyanobacteria bacterium J06648_16]